MKLYHGSNLKVEVPEILDSKRALDFGKGFYLTTDLEQAKRWAMVVTKRREQGIPTVSVFDYDIENHLNILKFDGPNIEWLRFISNNRKMIEADKDYDIIVGPVANDNTMPVINMYLSGLYDENEALKRLLPQNLKDQVVFKTRKALSYLKFLEEMKYE